MTGPDPTKPLVITAGEPAGIGPELCLALADGAWSDKAVIVADPANLRARAARLGVDVDVVEYEPGRPPACRQEPRTLCVLPQPLIDPLVCGTPDPANAVSLLDGLRRAVEGCSSGEFSALVTAPLQKSVIVDAGIPFTGHTEYLAELTGAAKPVMLLVADTLRVALATTHLPLRAVPDAIDAAGLKSVVTVLVNDLESRFGIAAPEIIVCGLNPHAGEGGHLGSEDRDIIAPAIADLRASGMDVRGPMPADSAFTPAAGRADAIVAMYHDQGLPVLKYAGFGTAVNVTLGLPIVRTSVDHGTALDIAGTGKADTGSLLAAIELAAQLAAR